MTRSRHSALLKNVVADDAIRAGQVTGGPDFDDSAEVKFVGTVIGIGKVTVEQSAAWTFNTFALCALVIPPLAGCTGILAATGITPTDLSSIQVGATRPTARRRHRQPIAKTPLT